MKSAWFCEMISEASNLLVNSLVKGKWRKVCATAGARQYAIWYCHTPSLDA